MVIETTKHQCEWHRLTTFAALRFNAAGEKQRLENTADDMFAQFPIYSNWIHIFKKGGRHMIELNYRDAKPIYEQIKDGLRKLILSGVICQDERLPSVRELASQLAINPNTIQKAYRELEQEGFSYTISGRGSFAAPLSEVSSIRQTELLKQFDEAVTELLYLKKEPEELKQRIDTLQQGGASE